MIQIYGSPRTSAGRCYLMLEELGLPYEAKPLDMAAKEHKSEAYRKLNPNGKVPALIDGDYVIWESLAINFYLAEKYRPSLLGNGAEEKGLVQQWSVWALAELQPPLVDMLIQLVFVPEPKQDMMVVEKARGRVPGMLEILDRHLSGRTYLVEEKLTLADFNVVSVVNLADGLKVDLEPFPHVRSWFTDLKSRPSFQRFVEKRS
ncbi:MAG: glutathione S-transferase family protein [Bdellovibrionales bacterium]